MIGLSKALQFRQLLMTIFMLNVLLLVKIDLFFMEVSTLIFFKSLYLLMHDTIKWFLLMKIRVVRRYKLRGIERV